jgi:hypothetical protein
MTGSNLVVSWVEYDLENVEVDPEFGDYPAFDNTFSYVECGDGCTPGQLMPRIRVVDGNLEAFSMYDILSALEDKQLEINQYVSMFNVISEWNLKVEAEVFTDALPKEFPAIPDAYSGPNFKSTSSLGGYGEPTEGHYKVTRGKRSGWKPYGSVGQSSDHELSVVMDHQDKSRQMLVTLVPMLESQTNIERASLEVGAYHFADFDFSEPMIPALSFAAGTDGSMNLVAGSIAALVAMTLY